MGSVSKKSSSRCTTVAEKFTHTFEIVGYSLKKGIGVGNFVRSGTFTVGGFDCHINFFPDGLVKFPGECMFILMAFWSKNATAPPPRVSYELRLLRQDSGLPGLRSGVKEAGVYNSSNGHGGRSGSLFVRRDVMELEESAYIRDDSFTVECVVTVIKESEVSDTWRKTEIDVPPSELSQHLGKLLEAKEGADVTFSVGCEAFTAHKVVLAMRSPVFKAELCGQMREARAASVTIEDIQPDVFKALLHFVYTDSLPDMGNDLDIEMIRHLLVAADRYAMDRLKLLCQNILATNINVENVATTLGLADQHNCDKLKQVCIEFLSSSNAMDAVVLTKGYASLKRTCPYMLVEVLEQTSRLRRS